MLITQISFGSCSCGCLVALLGSPSEMKAYSPPAESASRRKPSAPSPLRASRLLKRKTFTQGCTLPGTASSTASLMWDNKTWPSHSNIPASASIIALWLFFSENVSDEKDLSPFLLIVNPSLHR